MEKPKIVQLVMAPAVPLVHGVILVALADDGSIWQRGQISAEWLQVPGPGSEPAPAPTPGVVFS